MEIPWTITEEERLLAEECLGYAMKAGASGARVTMNKNMMDLFSMLNGELDKVTRSGDRSIMLCVFADGKYGTFSTNRLGEEGFWKKTPAGNFQIRSAAQRGR